MRTFCCLILVFSLFACNSGKNSRAKEVSLVLSDTEIHITIDEKTRNVTTTLMHNNTDELYFVNHIKNSIQVYNTTKQSLDRELIFDNNGPDGIGQLDGFVFVDSLFLIYARHESEIVIADFFGKIMKRVSYEPPSGYSTTRGISIIPNLYEKDNKVLIKATIDGNFRELGNNELKEYSLGYTLDLHNGETQLVSHRYPEDYWKGFKKDFSTFFVQQGQGSVFVYSLFADHRVFYANSEFDLLQDKEAKSRFFEASFEAIPLDGSRLERAKYFSAEQRYQDLLFDPYRNLYYRFAYHQSDILPESDLNIMRFYPKEFSILILDVDFNLIGESFIKNENRFAPSNCFVHKSGLYMSLSHPNNEYISEDEIAYVLFEIKTNSIQ